MADISITAASVIPSAGAAITSAIAGAAITAGQAVYLDSGGLAQLTDANGATALQQCTGIALQSVGSGQRVQIVTKDPALAIGATLNSGDRLYASPTPGGITKTSGDIVTGCIVIILGIVNGATGSTGGTVNFNPTAGGIV